jgi:UDP:flavonoid glycosyltransferase YjiC (YdhE family)
MQVSQYYQSIPVTHYSLLRPAASGHLNPMTTLGNALRERGHRVSLIGISDEEERVRAAGLKFVPIGLADYPAGCTKQLFNRLGELSGAAASRTTVAYFKQATAMPLREASPALRGQGVEALLVDQTSLGGATVAHALDLPFVSVSCALLLNSETAVPPVNTGWGYHPAAWARLRNRLGQQLLTRGARPITQVVVDYRYQHNLPVLTDSAQAWSPCPRSASSPLLSNTRASSRQPGFTSQG